MSQWEKIGNEVRIQGIATTLTFTKEDLEEGLRLLNEKPIFTCVDLTNEPLQFQKRGNVIKHNYPNITDVWCDVGAAWFGPGNCWHKAEILEAYAKAMRS